MWLKKNHVAWIDIIYLHILNKDMYRPSETETLLLTLCRNFSNIFSIFRKEEMVYKLKIYLIYYYISLRNTDACKIIEENLD